MSSAVSKIMKQSDPKWTVDEKETYAELWMGTHPSGPSVINETGEAFDQQPLSLLLQTFPEYVGSIDIVNKFGKDLPFLLKVLSVEQPLSIQSHPDKDLARKLHRKDPQNYPDANHKPEMAIALSPFEALCSFQPHNQIEANMRLVPEFKQVIGANVVEDYLKANMDQKKDKLKACFAGLMTASDESVSKALEQLSLRWKEDASDDVPQSVRHLFKRINAFYPRDVGCFAVFFLNYVLLQPGESIFLGANEPHAYIFGDCVECMALSDNVIRAGLTPKLKDISLLVESLTYQTITVTDLVKKAVSVDKFTRTYDIPVEDFAVDVIQVQAENANLVHYLLGAKESGSILLTLSGEAFIGEKRLIPGSVHFIPAMISLPILFRESNILMYRAYSCSS